MQISKDIRSGDKTVDSYLEALERELLSYQGSNVKKLIRSIDGLAGKISKDLDIIAKDEKNPDGTEVELSNKIVDTFLKMVEKADKIKNFSEVVTQLNNIPEEVKITTTVTTEETHKSKGLKVGDNPFEAVMNKVRDKKK